MKNDDELHSIPNVRLDPIAVWGPNTIHVDGTKGVPIPPDPGHTVHLTSRERRTLADFMDGKLVRATRTEVAATLRGIRAKLGGGLTL